jgi:phosphoglycolate phosphatase
MGVMHYFEVLIGREDVKNPKPHPEPVNKALEAMKKEKRNAWLVGDTPMDILAAKAAGIGAVGVTSGYADISQLRVHDVPVTAHALDAVKFITAL